MLALPDEVTDCEGALVKGDRDPTDTAKSCAVFIPARSSRAPLPPSLHVSAVLVLSPADARALARELERSAEEAEEQ